MVVLVNHDIAASVFVAILAIVGLFVISYFLLGSMFKIAMGSSKGALDKARAKTIAIIEANKSACSEITIDQFIEINRDFLNHCLWYGKTKGLDTDAAIEDTVIYSRDVFRAFSESYAPAEAIERQTELICEIVRQMLRLEALEAENKKRLTGGLSNSD